MMATCKAICIVSGGAEHTNRKAKPNRRETADVIKFKIIMYEMSSSEVSRDGQWRHRHTHTQTHTPGKE